MHRRSLLAGVAAFGLQAPVEADVVVVQPDALGLYMPHIRKMRGHDPHEFGDLKQDAAMIGDVETALPPDPNAKPQPPLDVTDAHVADALDTISERARDRRVVILNEAHNVSRCRAFAEAVALRLRSEGFDSFAAEDFLSEPGDTPFQRFVEGGPLTRWAGYYVGDPVYAEMERSVRRAGYRLVRYEQRSTQEGPKSAQGEAGIPYREHAEALNLAGFLRANPQSRVLVYCGYSHAAKRAVSHDRWMAARLIAMTGLDPLSIDQASGWPPIRPDPSSRVDQVLARFPISAPVALMRPDGAPIMIHGPYDGDFDIQVVHPRLPDVDGRPGWLARAPGRVRVSQPLPGVLQGETLVQAVRADEALAAPNAIPSDQYLVRPGAREAVFFLRPGRYVLRLEVDDSRRALGLFDAA